MARDEMGEVHVAISEEEIADAVAVASRHERVRVRGASRSAVAKDRETKEWIKKESLATATLNPVFPYLKEPVIDLGFWGLF